MNTSYLIELSKNYIQRKNGDVYKVTPKHFLKISPWNDGEDRRIFEISEDDCTILTCENACMIVNKQFENTDERWEHKGKQFTARAIGNKSTDEHAAMLSLLPSHKVLNQSKHLLANLKDNDSLTITMNNGLSELKMIKNKGKIYYILIVNADLPRVRMYDTFGKFVQWSNIKHCKPIFNETDKRYI